MNKTTAAIAIMAIMAACSCTKQQSLDALFNNQSKNIDSWINSFCKDKNLTKVVTDENGNVLRDDGGELVTEEVTVTVTGEDGVEKQVTVRPEVIGINGCYRVTVRRGTGKRLAEDGEAAIFYEGYLFTGKPNVRKDEVLFGTNIKGTAQDKGWSTSGMDFSPLTISPSDRNLVQGLRNAIVGVQAFEECYIVFNGKYGMGKKQFGPIPSNSALCYHIYVDSVQ